MSIKKETIIAMATALKLDVAAVTAAYDAKTETDVAFDPASVHVFTPTELTSREEQLKKNHEKAGGEIKIKSLKEKIGLEFDGKDDDKFIEAYQAKVLADAGVKESDKIKEKDQIIEGLRKNLQKEQEEKNTILAQTKSAQLDSDILSWTIDKKPDNLTNKEWLAVIKLNNELVEQDGQLYVKREGEIVKNSTDLKPVPAKDAVISFIEERKLGKQADAGAGGSGSGGSGRDAGDSKGAALGISNLKQFNAHLKEKGISPNGQQAQQLLNDITTKNPNFDFTPVVE